MQKLLSSKKTLIVVIICVLTFICFRYTLHNEFTNWDDDYYVTNDPYIKAFTSQNLKIIFTQDITKNNYHPLCMLSLAVNYYFAKLNPESYYLTNILIHVANTVFVFLLVFQFCIRLKIEDNGKLFIAGFCALWFGIHPMHVESVAWIAERKDVLYTFFYLLGLLCYIRYISANERKWYWATFFLFIASCLSKPMAVVFPLSLLCIDVLYQRALSKKLLTEKIIFFASSLICGAMAFYTQNKAGAVASFNTLTIQERFMYAAYGFIMYIAKIFNPTYLSTFYPYPYRYTNGWLPTIYYIAPFLAIAILAVPLYLTYKRNRTYFRVVAFGFGFFVANIIFVLQFVSVGAAIMADRYSYVAYIGLFFMIAYFLWEITKRVPSIKGVVLSALLIISGLLSYLCYERTFVWHNAETLLSDAIEKYPYQALLSYKWLGNYYLDKDDEDKALENYNVLVMLHAADAKIYDNVGNIYIRKQDYKNAITAFTASLQLQNNFYKTYLDRSEAYSMMGDTADAKKDYATAFRLSPNQEQMLAEKAFYAVQNRKYDDAIAQYNILLALSPSNPYYYFYMGVAQFSKNLMPQAISNWLTVIRLNSKDVTVNAAYNLSVAYDSVGDDKQAVHYAEMAQHMGYKVNPDYLAKLKEKQLLHK
jgi:protein O-mannosyl-transferase